VQYLRGVAAALVVLMHANAMMRYPEYFGVSPHHWTSLGLFGVSIFFVISGFIIAVVALQADGSPKLEAGAFTIRRFVRILPFMWLCVIGYNLLSYVGTGRIEWPAIARAMALWPVGELKPNVLWTLRHELLFYFLFTVALLWGKPRPWLLAVWFVAPLAVGGWVGTGNLAGSPQAELLRLTLMGDQNGANLQFGAGLLIGMLWLKRSTFMQPRLPFGPIVTLAVAAVATIAIERATPMMAYAPLRMAMHTLAATIVVWVGVIAKPEKSPLDALWVLLGDASYAIYLTHNATLLIAMTVVSHVKLPLSPDGFLAALILAGIVGGVIVHKLIERPLLRLLSHLFKQPTPALARAKGVA
jgi:exopolysaccharide production protein ExoZ